jgi:hypothetical protein
VATPRTPRRVVFQAHALPNQETDERFASEIENEIGESEHNDSHITNGLVNRTVGTVGGRERDWGACLPVFFFAPPSPSLSYCGKHRQGSDRRTLSSGTIGRSART